MSALCVTGALLDGERVALRAVDGLIAGLGPTVAPEPGDETIDAGGMLLVPPFVNGHTHAAMTLFRGYGDDLPLMEWLRDKIWPAEAKLEPADVYWGTRLAAIEMIRSGTARFFDMYWHGIEAGRAARDAGLRATAGAVLIDGLDPKRGERMRGEAMEQLDGIAELGPAIGPSFAPHAIYTVSRASLEWLGGVSRERGIPVQIHLSETEHEVRDCIAAHGMRPAHYLDAIGLLGERTVLAHGVWLDAAELELIAARGATIVTNPAANMKLAVGRAFPYPLASELGARFGLGTDGVSSNNNLDILEEVKLLSLLQKHETGDPSALPAAEALEIARGRRSPLLGGTPLEQGAPADFLLLRRDNAAMAVGDRDADLVYAASGEVVDTTVVAGRVLMRGREVEGEAEALTEVRARAARLTG